MTDPFLGEIRMFGGNFAPVGWALCDGQEIPISQNDALFTLIGTIYGGDGQQTFKLPDLRGRIPVHQGPSAEIGQAGGTESVVLTVQELPAHRHPYGVVAGAATSTSPQNATFANTSVDRTPYTQLANPVQLGPASSTAGGSAPHNNVMPFLCITFIICLNGIYPSRN